MAAEVQETLRGLCYDAGWCYAVFWKLKQQTHKVLAWEEGFYEPIKSLEMPETLSSRSHHFHLADHIGKTVDQMSCRIYSVGEGIIGQVAFTKKHQWIFSFRERQYPTEFHDQFAAGIQTIAVISVHQGVVQLGSTQTISEDLKLVAHVKELFGALQSMEGVNKSVAEPQKEGIYGVDLHSTTIAAANTTRMPAISDVWSSLAARGRHLKDEQGLHELYSPLQSRPQTVLGLQRSTSLSSSIPSHQLKLNPISTPQQECISSEGQPPHSLLYKLGLDSIVQYSSPSLTTYEAAMVNNATEKVESSFKTETINHPSFDATPSTMFWLFTDRHAKSFPLFQTGFTSELELPTEAISAGGGVSSKSSGMLCSRITSQACAENMLVRSVENPLVMHHACVAENDTLLNEAMNFDSSINSNCNSQNSLLDVQTCNLLDNHNLGELTFSERNLGEGQDLSSLLCDDIQHSLEAVHKKTEACLEAPSDDVLHRVFSSELDEFDNFIASLNKEQEKQDDGLTKSPFAPTLLEEVSEVLNRSIQKASFWDPPMVHGSLRSPVVQKQVATRPVVFSSKLKEETSTSCQTVESDVLHLERFCKRPKIESLYRNTENSTVPGPHNQKVFLSASMQDEPPQAGKKRARPGENARPRPKDRQQIQDRVRELRSIVPSSAKCSIDALLEKTIKYMSFLQTVTEDADKWKEDSKLQDYESNGDSNTIEGGASWAVELGGQGRECPLRVEDLSQPQHLLVEMLCEETGIFLEIADTIRGLGLTILKGLMESRNKKMWARFVVKAHEDVHRVHIVWSLMQLLETNTRTSSNTTNLACG